MTTPTTSIFNAEPASSAPAASVAVTDEFNKSSRVRQIHGRRLSALLAKAANQPENIPTEKIAVALRRDARNARTAQEKAMTQLASQLGCRWEQGPVKETSSLLRKAKDYGNILEVCDVDRGFFIVPNNRPDLLKKIVRLFESDPKTKQFKNKLETGTETGFRSCNAYQEFKGHICEIMILTQAMRDSYDDTHHLLRSFNNNDPETSIFRDMARMIHDAAHVASGYFESPQPAPAYGT